VSTSDSRNHQVTVVVLSFVDQSLLDPADPPIEYRDLAIVSILLQEWGLLAPPINLRFILRAVDLVHQ
jgi:hypothetical protein